MAHCLLHTSMLPSEEYVYMYSPFLCLVLFSVTIISSLHIYVYTFFEANYCTYFSYFFFCCCCLQLCCLILLLLVCVFQACYFFSFIFCLLCRSISVPLYLNPRLFWFLFLILFILLLLFFSFSFSFSFFSTRELLSITLRFKGICLLPPISGEKRTRGLLQKQGKTRKKEKNQNTQFFSLLLLLPVSLNLSQFVLTLFSCHLIPTPLSLLAR